MIPSDAVVVCIKRVMKANVYWYRKLRLRIVGILVAFGEREVELVICGKILIAANSPSCV